MSRSGTGVDDQKAWSVFFTAEKNVGSGHLSLNGTFIDWDGVIGGIGDGNTLSLQAAFQPAGSKWQPTLRWQQQNPDTGTKLDTIGIGLNYYLSGHRVNIKSEYSIDDLVIGGSKKDAFRMQVQLFF